MKSINTFQLRSVSGGARRNSRTDSIWLLSEMNLKSEAEAFSQFDLWKVLHDTPQSIAQKAMFMDDGTIENQLLKGRCILYMLDLQKNLVNLLKEVQIKV